MALIFCGCGCGGQREEFDSQKRKRLYIKGHSRIGSHVSEELKKKLSNMNKGMKHPQYGTHPSQKVRDKISISHIGKPSNMKNKTHSEETKLKMQISALKRGISPELRLKMIAASKGTQSGKNNPMYGIHLMGELSGNWKGGITPLNEQIRHSSKYNEWRLSVFQRDSFTCETCKKVGGILNAHHIVKFSSIIYKNNIKSIDEALNCNDLWDLNNGITLCKECHLKIKRS